MSKRKVCLKNSLEDEIVLSCDAFPSKQIKKSKIMIFCLFDLHKHLINIPHIEENPLCKLKII
jgi:hypothetical protein